MMKLLIAMLMLAPIYLSGMQIAVQGKEIVVKHLENKDNGAAIISAVIYGNVGVVQKLLEKDSTLANHQDKYCRTPLHYAAWIGKSDVVCMLRAMNASLTVEDKDGRTPADMALDKHSAKSSLIRLLDVSVAALEAQPKESPNIDASKKSDDEDDDDDALGQEDDDRPILAQDQGESSIGGRAHEQRMHQKKKKKRKKY